MHSLLFQISNLKKVLKGILDYNQEVRTICYVSYIPFLTVAQINILTRNVKC